MMKWEYELVHIETMEPYFDINILRQLTLKINVYCICVKFVDLSLFPFPIEPMCVFGKPFLERGI